MWLSLICTKRSAARPAAPDARRVLNRHAFEDAARHRPDRAGSDPCHALQKVPPLVVAFVVLTCHAYLPVIRAQFTVYAAPCVRASTSEDRGRAQIFPGIKARCRGLVGLGRVDLSEEEVTRVRYRVRAYASARSCLSATNRLKRRGLPRRPAPNDRPQPRPHVRLGLGANVMNQSVHEGSTCAFGKAVPHPQDRAAHASFPFSAAAAARGTTAYTNANLSLRSRMRRGFRAPTPSSCRRDRASARERANPQGKTQEPRRIVLKQGR